MAETNKAVLMSIQPKWCELIAAGRKTVEIRKTKPKLETPFKVHIYCTKDEPLYESGEKFWTGEELGNGKVIGEFVCKAIANLRGEFWDDDTYEGIVELVEPDDFAEYGEYECYTLVDNGDEDYKDNPLCKASCLTWEQLREYVGEGIHDFYAWHISDLVIYEKPRGINEFVSASVRNTNCFGHHLKRLKRAPQSWCYVEECYNG